MSPARPADMPIYDALVEELGDVPAEARLTAERTLRDVGPLMDFRLGPAPAPSRLPQRASGHAVRPHP
ncbi:hypothetical protein AB0M29_38765 [Streptomyces sp. NPDC051976]|uniref:hypothetical protein n=1 Tax=Streptomyces sp. NPDC051976 TaxID=3154947 RepID=UPI003444F2CB